MSKLDETLAERGARYGDFTDHARVAQQLQTAMRNEPGWQACNDVQRQALTVIADKIARVLTGDPNYADNWHAIQGYAKLVEDRLPVMGVDFAKTESGDWIEWKGGECPLLGHERVDVRFADTSEWPNSLARGWGWQRHGDADDIVAYRLVEEAPKPDADGWIAWKGGECPVPEAARVDVRFKDGGESRKRTAGGWDWTRGGGSGDIVAYRLVKD